MDSPVTPLVASPVLPAALPGWALPRGRDRTRFLLPSPPASR